MYQQNSGLPFSNRELQAPLMNLAYGQAPIMFQVPSPPELAQFVPLIINQLIISLQEKATANQLRTFLYNQMAVNGYNNQDFINLLTIAVEVVDLVMRTTPGASIETVIQKSARNVVQFMASVNATKFPDLTYGLQPADITLIQRTIGEFDTEVTGMKRMVSMPQQQPQGNWGVPNTWGNGGGYGGGMGGGYSQQMPRQAYGVGHPSANQGFGGINAGGNNQSGWRGRTVGEKSVKTIQAGAPDATPVRPPRSTFREAQAATIQSRPAVTTVDPSTTFLPPVEVVAQTDVDILDKERFVWLKNKGNAIVEEFRTSKQYPFTFAYNPSMFNLVYVVEGKDVIRPILVNKDPIPMDRNAHLTAPKISSTWVFPVTPETVGSPIRKMALVPEDLVFEQFPFKVPQSASQAEHWTFADLYLGSTLIDREGKRQVLLLPGLIAEPKVCNDLLKQDIRDLTLSTTIKHCVQELTRMKEKAEERSERHDILVVNHINKMLTDRINRFVRNELALTSGTITSFLPDILDLPGYLDSRYGSTAAKALIDQFGRMLDETLSFMQDTSSEGVLEYYCGEFMDKVPGPAGNRNLVTFYQKNKYALVDLSSVELQVDLGSTKVAVGVKESLTPLFYSVCASLLGEYDPTNAQMFPTRYFVRTNDGVTFEITRGALNKEFFFASLAS
jgi:hypothetical protein